MYPSQYQGETLWYSLTITSDTSYSTNVDEMETNRVYSKGQEGTLNN